MRDVAERLRASLAGRYTVEDLVGMGGTALVYRGRDLRHDRAVALKVLKPELSSDLGPERFLREIRLTAGLLHPNILPLHDSGEAQGLLYYVMPFVSGESLRARMRREGQLPLDDAVEIARAVADALDYAHRRQIVHRDIKPENILLSEGRPLVSDFGIGKLLTAAGGGAATQTGIVIGTPAYMSPEQASGAGDLDGRSDIYSLGCVLYEMLAGEPPFAGPTTQIVVSRRLTEPPPSIRSAREVPAQLEAAVQKALARLRADRFATAAQLAEALRPPVHSTPTPAVRTPSHVALPLYGKSVAVLPFANLSPDPDTAYFADGMTEEIINALTQIRELHVAARTSSFAFKDRTPELTEVGEKLKVATVLEGSVRKAGRRLRITAQLVNVADGYHLWSERFDRDLDDVFAIQDEIASAIASKLELTMAEGAGEPLVKPPTGNLEAYQLYLKGRHLWNQRGYGLRDAVGFFEQALALEPDYALAHAGLADAYNLLAFYGLARPHEVMPKAKAAARRALEIDPNLPEAHAASGWTAMAYGWDYAAAGFELRRAIELNPRFVAAHYWLATLLGFVEGRFEEALAEGQYAVDLDPLAPHPLVQLGATYMGTRQFERAVRPLRRAIELQPSSHLAFYYAALVYSFPGRHEEAIRSMEAAVALSGRHPWPLGGLAYVYIAAGRAADGEAVLAELVARSQREYVQPVVFAIAHAILGRRGEAFTWLDRACEERDAVLPLMRTSPLFDPLRDDARWGIIARRVNWPA